MSRPALAILRKQVKALLTVEDMFEGPEHSWIVNYKSPSGLEYVIGKGGKNTMFYVLGDGERKICYPNDLLDQTRIFHEAYYIKTSKLNGPYPPGHLPRLLNKVKLKKGWKLVGQIEDRRVVIGTAQHSLILGKVYWVISDSRLKGLINN